MPTVGKMTNISQGNVATHLMAMRNLHKNDEKMWGTPEYFVVGYYRAPGNRP